MIGETIMTESGIEQIQGIHESLFILNSLVVQVETEKYVGRKQRKLVKRITTHRKVHCKCYLCGREYEFSPKDFEIRNDAYSSRAKWGYYSEAWCDCHETSSFQWRTVRIFHEHNIPYQVEVSFPDLLSDKGNPLRFDFAILNADKSIKCLLECQGEQHFHVGGGYGGYSALKRRQEHDELKRQYAKAHNIPLYEIPYTYNTFEKEVACLQKIGIVEEKQTI